MHWLKRITPVIKGADLCEGDAAAAINLGLMPCCR
jgi:hypothetical protein